MKRLSYHLVVALGSVAFAPIARAQQECAPAREYVLHPQPDGYGGQYLRIHPSGDYILHSGNGVSIVDISGRDAEGKRVGKIVKTPLIDETYPVEGTWKLLASPNNWDGMRYYKFDDVMQVGKNAQPVFNDRDHNEFYHSVAELEGSKPEKMKFRTLLWSRQRYRDYEVEFNPDGSMKEVKKGESSKLCANLDGPKPSAEEVDRARRRMAEIRTAYSSASPEVQSRLLAEFYDVGVVGNGGVFQIENPIQSKDGKMIAGVVKGTVHVYNVAADGTCELLKDLGFRTSKVSFSYPEPGKKGRIAFTASNVSPGNNVDRAYVHDLDTGITTPISVDREDPAYPGFTQDGRVIYRTLVPNGPGGRMPGFAIVDTKQVVDGKPPTCRNRGAEGARQGTGGSRGTSGER